MTRHCVAVHGRYMFVLVRTIVPTCARGVIVLLDFATLPAHGELYKFSFFAINAVS